MIKQTYPLQKGGYRTLIRALVAAAVSLSLVFTALIRPPSAQAIYSSSVSGNTATLIGDIAGDTIIIDVSAATCSTTALQQAMPALTVTLIGTALCPGDQTLLNASNRTVNINAGDGNDTIILGTAATHASLLLIHFDINGQASSDTLIITTAPTRRRET